MTELFKKSLFALFAITAILVCSVQAFSQDAVERGRDAFTNQGNWDWYDSKTDALKPLAPPTTRPPVDRESNRRPSANSGPGGATGGTGGSGGAGGGSGGGGPGSGFNVPAGGSLGALGQIFNIIAMIIVVITVVLIVGAIIWAIAKMDWSKDADEMEEIEEREEVPLSPVEKLPFQVDPSIGNFLDAARKSYQNQDYNHAAIYLFSHTLLTLDQNQWIRLTRGKTNRQYLAEIKGNSELKRFFENIMIPFESAFFGNIKITRQNLDAAWSSIDRFHQSVRRPTNIPGQNPNYQPAINWT